MFGQELLQMKRCRPRRRLEKSHHGPQFCAEVGHHLPREKAIQIHHLICPRPRDPIFSLGPTLDSGISVISNEFFTAKVAQPFAEIPHIAIHLPTHGGKSSSHVFVGQ
jgi:hypothetical protein